MQLRPIAHTVSAFPDKFGVPRQSGLVPELQARVVFEPEYALPEAVRGLEGFSHIWLIWGFSLAHQPRWSPTVRPPRLGGDKRVGVFASRSPFRPNALGLSSVALLGIEQDAAGLSLLVAGADLVNGTPIYDIKPYLRYTDSHPEARDGFVAEADLPSLEVDFPPHLLALLPDNQRESVIALLRLDPRPAYQEDADRRYGFRFEQWDIRFQVKGNVCQVVDVVPLPLS